MHAAPGTARSSAARCRRTRQGVLRHAQHAQHAAAPPPPPAAAAPRLPRHSKPQDRKSDPSTPQHHHQQPQQQHRPPNPHHDSPATPPPKHTRTTPSTPSTSTSATQQQGAPITPLCDDAGNILVKLSRTTSAARAAGSITKCLQQQPYLQLLYTDVHPIFIAARALGLANLMQASSGHSVFFVPTLAREAPAPPGRAGGPRRRLYTAHVYTEPLADATVEGHVQRVQDHATDWRSYRKARGVNEERAHGLADVLYGALEDEGDAVVVADTHAEITTAMHAVALCNRRIAMEGQAHMLGCTVLFESALRKGARPGRMLFLAEKRIMPGGDPQGLEAGAP